MASETLHVDVDGHRLAYRVTGRGPAVVMLYLYRRRADLVQARMLSARWRVFQVFPLGYGYSDRVPGYAGEALADQIGAVLDRHEVDRFVVWGYSKGGAMAACIARGTHRAAGLVCGGFSLAFLTPGRLRQLDRRLRPDHPSRSLWWWFDSIDWSRESSTMPAARLFYWGSEDRQMAAGLRRSRDRPTLLGPDVDHIEFAGLDHAACNQPEALEHRVVPAVSDWVTRRLGASW